MADTTPTLREAAQQALEALEQATRPQRWPFAVKQDTRAAITALRAALAEQGAEQVVQLSPEYGATDFGFTFAGIDLEDGDRRLMAMLVTALGTEHPAIDDMVALLFRARKPAPAAEQAEPVETIECTCRAEDMPYGRCCKAPPLKTTDRWESARVADYNAGWNACCAAMVRSSTPAEPWGWAIVDANGDECCTRPRVKRFFGAVNHEIEPFTAEDVAHADRENPGVAPHRVVTLFSAPPAPARQEWQPIETAPRDGFMLVHEDGAIRALLRANGVWHKCGYPALIASPWGDALVGEDARRLLPSGFRLEIRDGCCENPTHWMQLPAAPITAAPAEGGAA